MTAQCLTSCIHNKYYTTLCNHNNNYLDYNYLYNSAYTEVAMTIV